MAVSTRSNVTVTMLLSSFILTILSLSSNTSSFVPNTSNVGRPPSIVRRWTIPSVRTIANDDDPDDGVVVWDGVFRRSEDLKQLHEWATDHNRRVESSVFVRRRRRRRGVAGTSDDDDDDLTPLERALDSVLSAVEETQPTTDDEDDENEDEVVEYWSRQHHLNIDVHSDVDEEALLEDAVVRTPAYGHVLYLDVGEHVAGAGPTVIFPTKRGGWGEDEDDNGGETPTSTSMVTVPAVPGRVVRFDGSAMHAVPRPALRWTNAHFKKEKEEEEEEDDDEYDHEFEFDNEDDEDDDQPNEEDSRSVVLFNTWPVSRGSPPRGVGPDPRTGRLPDGLDLGITLDEEDVDEDEETVVVVVVNCEPPTRWTRVPIAPPPPENDDDVATIRVPLLGNAVRRGRRSRSVQGTVRGRATLERALSSAREVSELRVTSTSTLSNDREEQRS